MCHKLYILALVLQCVVCDKIENDSEIPSDYMGPSNEYVEIVPMNSITDEWDNEKTTAKAKGKENEKKPKEKICFSGPVRAKGAVSVSANFGYNPPGLFNYPLHCMNPLLPSFTPYYFYPPPMAYPIPYTIPYIPIASYLLPGMGNLPYLEDNPHNFQRNNAENNFKNSSENILCKVDMVSDNKIKEDIEKLHGRIVKIDKNNIHIEIIPINKINETELILDPYADDTDDSENVFSLQQILANPKVFLDEDFTDYDENNIFIKKMRVNDTTDIKKDVSSEFNDKKQADISEERLVFGGLIPAKGSVKIAARF